MTYIYKYKTPNNFSDLFLLSDGKVLTGIFFNKGRNITKNFIVCENKRVPAFEETIKWLDIYFSGKEPDFTPDFKTNWDTELKREVYEIIMNIPFGSSITYGEIAKIIEKKRGIKKMAPQAIGRVVGLNDFPLIVPCHRVLGKDGSLTGYNGGMQNKAYLMLLENIEEGKNSALDYIEYQKHKIYKD